MSRILAVTDSIADIEAFSFGFNTDTLSHIHVTPIPFFKSGADLAISYEGGPLKVADLHDGKGRTLISTCAIEPGDKLIGEMAASFVLAADLVKTCCSYCTEDLTVAITCPECHQSRFCSNECMAASQHPRSLECQFSLVQSQVDDLIRLALRSYSLMHADPTFCEKYNSLAVNSGCNIAEISTLLASKLSLLVAESCRDVFIQDFSRTLRIQTCNSFVVNKEVEVASPFDTVEISSIRAGSGIFFSSSMLNHSCEPVAVQSFEFAPKSPPKICINANCHIKNGADVTISYGPLAFMERRSKRRKHCASLGFECTCRACLDDSNDSRFRLRCMFCQAYHERSELCESCGRPWLITQDYLRNVRLKFDQGENLPIQDIFNLVRSVEKILPESSLSLASMYDRAAQILCSVGIFDAAAILTEKGIKIIEGNYGVFSAETLEEKFKLCTILMQTRMCQELHDLTAEILPMMIKMHGNAHQDTQELLHMQQHAKTFLMMSKLST